MLIFDTYVKTWPMCLASLGFFMVVAGLAYRVRIPRLDRELSSRRVFWACLGVWFVLLSVCLILVDKPHFDLAPHTKGWLFMFSAFLGIPLTVPLLACAAWALAHQVRGEGVKLSALLLVGLGSFGLGCAASNIHDVVWCGVITHWYTQHFKAGYDLDLFVAVGKRFGIPGPVLGDYATLGPYTILLVLGEVAVSVASFLRLQRLNQPSSTGSAGENP